GSVFYASGQLLYLQDGSLMAQPFDSLRLELRGAPVTVVDRELARHEAFSQTDVSFSETGAAVFPSLSDAASELVWFDRSGRESGRIPLAGLSDPQLSPDDRFLATTSDQDHSGHTVIKLVDLARGGSTPLTDGGHEMFPVWSRDGARIAYRS